MKNSKLLEIGPGRTCSSIEEFIQREVEKLERSGVVIGISGGGNSAACAALAVRALGPENVHGLIIKEKEFPQKALEDARLVASELGIKCEEKDMTSALTKLEVYKILEKYEKFRNAPTIRLAHNIFYRMTGETPHYASLLGTKNIKYEFHAEIIRRVAASMRAKMRTRALIWNKYADLNNFASMSCSNESKRLVGWAVKWGACAADIAPIAGLLETQVRQIAYPLGVNEKIIKKDSNPDMLIGITTEFALAIAFYHLDPILEGFKRGFSDQEIVDQFGVSPKKINYVRRLIDRSSHMRGVTPHPRISSSLYTVPFADSCENPSGW